MRQLDNNRTLFSPTDLTNFLGCQHATYLDLKCFREEIPPPVVNESNRLLQEKGFEHEKNYLKQLREQNKKIIEISRTTTLTESIKLTQEALHTGADVIYQAHLHDDFWTGHADFLIKVDIPSSLGSYSYQVIDTKLTRTPEPKHLIQLCAYTDLLSKLQSLLPKQMALVLGDSQQRPFNYSDFAYYYKIIKNNFEGYANNPPTQSSPKPCEHCKVCHWQSRCKEQWQTEDHLSLVANIKRAEIDQLNKGGITTVAALANLADDFPLEEMNLEILQRLREQARLQLYKRETGHEKYELLTPIPHKGFERLPQPNEGDLFFDMEGDPLYPQGLEYLFGVYFQENKQWHFKAFWAHNHPDEKKTFKQFMKFLKQHLTRFPDAHIYHYNHYENTALKRLACRYGVCEDQVDNLLREKKLVDLYKVVREGIRISESGYSIKDLEVFYMDKRDNSVQTAMDSIDVYNQWLITKNPQLLNDIEEYNKVDCISTLKLRDWLISIKPINTAWFRKEEEVKKTKPRSPSQRNEPEITYEQYQKLLKTKIENKKLSERLINLLEYHKRESKPKWWSVFERQDKFDYELIEDTECLGGLTLLGEPISEKRSYIYTYRFPPQEFKLHAGSSVLNTASTKGAGTIVELNDEQRLVKIKLGKASGELPPHLSISPTGPRDTKKIRSALYRVADNILNANDKYQAILDILNKRAPYLNNKLAGQPIINSDKLQDETFEAIKALNNSYLFIQGPPGTGKTYTSSHIIVELLKNNKKIGIASNSHKAIHNLLGKIEKVAIEQSFHFKGIKRSSENEDSYEGTFISNNKSGNIIPSDYSLYAGTAWFFVDEFFEENPLDYLFIDEAGQVCLANVVAMGTATKNIILVGDQMQLAQPMQGTHPGESGLSILDFLLGNHATVSPDRGIFLKDSYRMRPSICNFISQAFYDGLLNAHPSVNKYQLFFNNVNLPNDGICIVPMDHEGCSQKSVEEGEIIKSLYKTLIEQKFKDDEDQRKLTPADILIVSPYNVQVNYLRSILPAGARVGTIDKFQGQEAAIVLISMATSSAEDLPRNIEFLYSKNRLNVAISRAHCLAIVVFSKKLLNITCKTIEQMKLVNSLCWLYDYGQKIY
ncbi:putative RNA helicase [Legionella beliardensis]|uniref:Putative RNA helicase n=1 Tax=Legionella beliardensis TaxID=91822 RepID=A0A378I0C0_9GAMM|nr:TM0106 family RecB-like putative nuclease [Legionella beliardensis]STX28422.1 putative RNA helicase [Legionella beliardensis]